MGLISSDETSTRLSLMQPVQAYLILVSRRTHAKHGPVYMNDTLSLA